MKNTDILGISNPLPAPVEKVKSRAEELQEEIDEQLEFEREEFKRLAEAGADYGGMDTLRAIMGQLGRM